MTHSDIEPTSLEHDATLVRLEIPRSLEFVPMARVAVAGYAARLGFDIDGIENARIAIDEMTSILVEHGDGEVVGLSMFTDDAQLHLEGRTACARSTQPPVLGALTAQILSAVVDTFAFGADEDVVWYRSSRRLADGP